MGINYLITTPALAPRGEVLLLKKWKELRHKKAKTLAQIVSGRVKIQTLGKMQTSTACYSLKLNHVSILKITRRELKKGEPTLTYLGLLVVRG